jgi:hypothetical protein
MEYCSTEDNVVIFSPRLYLNQSLKIADLDLDCLYLALSSRGSVRISVFNLLNWFGFVSLHR